MGLPGLAGGLRRLIGYENRLYLHYVIVAMPPLILLSAPAVGWLWARIRSPEPWLRRVAFGLWAGTVAMLGRGRRLHGGSDDGDAGRRE